MRVTTRSRDLAYTKDLFASDENRISDRWTEKNDSSNQEAILSLFLKAISWNQSGTIIVYWGCCCWGGVISEISEQGDADQNKKADAIHIASARNFFQDNSRLVVIYAQPEFQFVELLAINIVGRMQVFCFGDEPQGIVTDQSRCL